MQLIMPHYNGFNVVPAHSPYFPENHPSQSEIHVFVDRQHKACEVLILIQLQI